ncbi:hypothetical protein DIURU_004057 [Diutina rugosa]|uniref:Uncharacterized protein n=1 Tax=Diutina rugosa TaxID=5481 RepID=A0A642UIQ3_DIURU|nr:uncharacterized protein DIURU_004057 [Diutina rugosa]KAA8899800.1 hypothetical protein DIURU_004057 [Diutina rugosa]
MSEPPQSDPKMRLLPLIQSPEDLLDKLSRLKDAAFRADVEGYTESFNAYLKQWVDQVLPTTANRISIDINASAQSNLSNIQKTVVVQELAAAFVNEVGDVKYEAGNLDSVSNVLHLLKKSYRLVDHLEPTTTAKIAINLFPNITTYPEHFQTVLDDFNTIIEGLETPVKYKSMARGQVRGKILLLLNTLPSLVYTDDNEIAAWKSKHLSDLYEPWWGSPPSVSSQGTTDTEWERFKPRTKSVLETHDFFGYDNETQTSRSSVPDDRNMARSQLISDHLARGINLLTNYCREFADGSSQPSSSEEKTVAMIHSTFERFQEYPFDDYDDSTDLILQVGPQLVDVFLAIPRLHDSKLDVSRIILTFASVISQVVLTRIESRGPMAFLTFTDSCSFVVSRSVISKFKKTSPYVAKVPWGEIVVEGTGTLKVVDNSGQSVAVKAFYAPKGINKPMMLYDNQKVTSSMSDAIPAVINVGKIPHDCHFEEDVACDFEEYNACDFEEDDAFIKGGVLLGKGAIDVLKCKDGLRIPLRSSPKLARMIKVWAFMRDLYVGERTELRSRLTVAEMKSLLDELNDI